MNTEVPEKIVKVKSPLLNCDVTCRKIKNVLFADWDTMDQWLPDHFKSGQIYFKPVDPERINVIRYAKFVDMESKITFGILQPVNDDQGYPILRHIQFTGTENFDLSNKTNRIKAIILMHQRFIIDGPLGENGSAGYVIMTSVQEKAKENRKRREKTRLAMDVIRSLAGQELRSFARILIPVDAMNDDEVIMDHLEDFAEKTPEKLLNEWRNTDRSLKELFERARDYGVIQFRQDLGWIYEEHPLGYNDIDVMSGFKNNPILLGNISRASLDYEKQAYEQKKKSLPADLETIIKQQSGLSKEDQSISDIHKRQQVQQEHPEVNVMEEMKSFGESLLQRVDQLVEEKMKISQKEKIKETVDEFEEHEERSAAVQNHIEEKIQLLANGVLRNQDYADWKYQDLKKYVSNRVPAEESAGKINMKKEDLWEFIISWEVQQLEKGILEADDSSTDSTGVQE